MDIKKYLNAIHTNSLFVNFTEDQLLSLLKQAHFKILSYKKGSLIYIENQNCTTFDIILQGKILVQEIHQNGNILTISEFNEGDNFGGNLVFSDNNIYPMTVIAKTNSTILHLEKELILHLCQLNKIFLCELLKSLSSKTIIISSKLKSITMRTIRQRIVEFLVSEYYKKEVLKIPLNMSKKEWAEKLGVQRPSLSRELSTMKREGLIDYTRNYILIKDIDLLQKL